MRQKLVNKSIRKIYKKSGSYGVTIPMEIVKKSQNQGRTKKWW